jgi:hypothetical protein
MQGGSAVPTSCRGSPSRARTARSNSDHRHASTTTARPLPPHLPHYHGRQQLPLLDRPQPSATFKSSPPAARLPVAASSPQAAMDDLREQVELLESSANLSTSISHVQRAIDLLTAARARVAAGVCLVANAIDSMLTITRPDPQTAPTILSRLQDPLKKSLEAAQKDLKPIYSGLNKYGKVLDKVRLHAQATRLHPF